MHRRRDVVNRREVRGENVLRAQAAGLDQYVGFGLNLRLDLHLPLVRHSAAQMIVPPVFTILAAADIPLTA